MSRNLNNGLLEEYSRIFTHLHAKEVISYKLHVYYKCYGAALLIHRGSYYHKTAPQKHSKLQLYSISHVHACYSHLKLSYNSFFNIF